MANIEHCTPKMVTEGARALDLWSDESLREEIDGRRMAELVWKAMAPHSNYRGAVSVEDVERLLAETSRYFAGDHVNAGVVVGEMRKRLRALGGQ